MCESGSKHGCVSGAASDTAVRSASLPGTIEPIRRSRPSARAPPSVAQRRASLCRHRLGVAGNGLGKQRGRAHLLEHVEPIVARRTVGADADVHAVREELGDRREPARELQVGRRAVRHRRARPGEGGDLGRREIDRMHGDQPLGQEPEPFETFERAAAVLLRRSPQPRRRVSCTCTWIGRSSSSASVAMRRNVASLTVYGACGAMQKDRSGSSASRSRSCEPASRGSPPRPTRTRSGTRWR